MKVVVLHAYSADNAGDGILVEETLALLAEALGSPPEVTLLASRPQSFAHLDVVALPTVPGRRGYDPRTRRVLRDLAGVDLVVAVGGGYLRAGTPLEAAKSVLVQGPQLWAAARTATPTLYLPQSIGPVRWPLRAPLRALLQKMDGVLLRDDRSVAELALSNAQRSPDLAIRLVTSGRRPGSVPDAVPVLSVRAVRGRVPAGVYTLASRLAVFDSYLQSTTGGNNDRAATASFAARHSVERETLMGGTGAVRVVVAMRLHAALMAMAAGHYVVHLSYERKGFGAFGDLGLDDWVHNANTMDVAKVQRQVQLLTSDAGARASYDAAIAGAAAAIRQRHSDSVSSIRDLVDRSVSARPR